MISSEKDKPSVFVSYNWESTSNALVDKIQQEFSNSICLVRDKNSAEPWKSIDEFMQRIRDTDWAIVVISNKYLKSINCMYEISQLMKDSNWKDKTLFVVMNSANKIYNATKRLSYVEYWKCEYDSLEKILKKFNPSEGMSSRNDLNKINEIRMNLENVFLEVPKLLNANESNVIERLKSKFSIPCDNVVKEDEPIAVIQPKEIDAISALWEDYVPLHHVIGDVKLWAINPEVMNQLFSFKTQVKMFEVKYDQKKFYLNKENRELIENFLDNLISFAENSIMISSLARNFPENFANAGTLMVNNVIQQQIRIEKNDLLVNDINKDFQVFSTIMDKIHTL